MAYAFSMISKLRLNLVAVTFILVFILSLSLTLNSYYHSEENAYFSHVYGIRAQTFLKVPIINDPNLDVQIVYKGLKSPTAMAFLGPDDILVLEKNLGTVQRIIKGKISQEPLLLVNVNFADERGLLGIAIAPKEQNKTKTTTIFPIKQKINNPECLSLDSSDSSLFLFFECFYLASPPISPYSFPPSLFLFFTEAESEKDDTAIGNRLYKYEIVETNDSNTIKLVNPIMLLDLPVGPAASHVGGMLDIGPDNNLYLTVGDQRPTVYNKIDSPDSQTKAQNYMNGKEPDGRAGILRITQNGEVVGEGIVGKEHPLNKYYAYGIKNSFGFDFDPVTGNLWDTENGPSFGDEINLVEPGFNSGWSSIQGFWRLDNQNKRIDQVSHSINPANYDLIDFGGKGHYSSPEFVWDVAPTALKFLNSNKLGKEYENDMFIGDIKNGNIYHFELDEKRKGLNLDGPLADKIADIHEIQQIIFAQGFGGITDIEVGPDGYLYILTYSEVDGTIYRIVPRENRG